ncbi:MAG: alpha/beta hydrolase, partial [Pseudomonadota bacterium]
MKKPNFQMIDTNGIRLRAVVEGEGPLVLMVHGFPESWYSWRHQIGPIAAAGFTACAIDVRGYGGSDKPPAVEDYAMEHMLADLVGVAKALGGGKPATIIGHDWGAPQAHYCALRHPDVFGALGTLSVPFVGIFEPGLIAMQNQYLESGEFFYQNHFQEPGVAEAEMEADIRTALRKFYFALSGESDNDHLIGARPHGAPLLDVIPDPDPFPAWWTEEDIDYVVGEFERSGLRGPLNRYRNLERDLQFMEPYLDKVLEQPSLFVGGAKDVVLKFAPPGVDML